MKILSLKICQMLLPGGSISRYHYTVKVEMLCLEFEVILLNQLGVLSGVFDSFFP